jgi:two-component system, NtrC family, sensor kinase
VSCSLLSALHLNRLQRKVLLVVLAIVLVPMLVTGVLSASWVAGRMDDTIERWIREAAQVNSNWLDTLNKNGQLFADLFDHLASGQPPRFVPGKSPIPRQLEPLARELGINLIQVFDPRGRRIYSSSQVSLRSAWEPGQNAAVLKADQGEKRLLAAVTIVRYPPDQPSHYRLVIGTVFDQELLARLSRMSGLRTRLFYPRDGDFAKAFSEEGSPLRLRLPPVAFERLKQQHDYYSDTAENGEYWGLYTPVSDSGGRVEAVLFSGLKHHGGDRFLTDQAAVTVAVILLGTLLAAITGLLLSRLLVRPVTLLREGVMKVAAQDFRASVPIAWRDEIGDLARAFNSMATTLRETRDQQLRDFQRDKIASLGELSLALAHEIRNPVGVINTASRLLETTENPAKRTDLYRMIREECQRLDQFLRDFQQLARHRKPQLELIDPAAPLERALQVMLTGHDGITVSSDYRHGESRIRADADLLQQAWVNLVRNALEAMQGKGSLRVGSALEGRQIVLYLHDSGPGIPVESMTRLFEPFYTTKVQGSGLGLTLASTLVEASGATLELVPGSGAGARFAMRFTIAEDM